MARQRVESGIKSWQGADEALLAIGQIDRQIEVLEAHAQGEIEEVKERTIAAVKPRQERKAALELQLQAFCEAQKEELKGKSRKLNFGTVSFRQSTRIIIKGLQACMAALMRLDLVDYLIIKRTPNKERLKELDDATLSQIGAKREVKDVFGYEVDRTKVMEAA